MPRDPVPHENVPSMVEVKNINQAIANSLTVESREISRVIPPSPPPYPGKYFTGLFRPSSVASSDAPVWIQAKPVELKKTQNSN